MITLLYAPVEGAPAIQHALRHIMKFQKRGRTVVFSRTKPDGDVSWVESPKQNWVKQQRHQATGLVEFLEKDDDFLLHCECDGFPINPELWDDAWLQYDYVGAPWGVRGVKGCVTSVLQGVNRVGNGGFSLRSRSLLEDAYKKRLSYPEGVASDVWLCQYPWARITFPSINTAAKFSFESFLPELPDFSTNDSFGFHGRTLHPHLCTV